MGSFREEIANLNHQPQVAVVTVDLETKMLYKCRADKYIDAICEQIKGAIRREASAGKVACDQVQKGWIRKHWQEYNHHYRVYWNVTFELDFCKSVFESIQTSGVQTSDDIQSRFVVNDYDMIDYILRAVAKTLKADEIYPAQPSLDNYMALEFHETTLAKKFPDETIQKRYNECVQAYLSRQFDRPTFKLIVPFVMFI